MYEYEGSLVGTGRTVQFKKARIKGGRFLYSFKDVVRAAKEAKDWMEREKDLETGLYDVEKFKKKEPSFGSILFLSNLDMQPLQAYRCYEERWMIETVFNHYKNDIDLDMTRAQGDRSVMGSEFINFIATIMTCRILRKASKAGIFERMSYAQMMEDRDLFNDLF